jgi:hypothetical protein
MLLRSVSRCELPGSSLLVEGLNWTTGDWLAGRCRRDVLEHEQQRMPLPSARS